MAIATLKLASINSPAGDVTLTLEYDDALLRATAVICDNPSIDDVSFSITRDSDGRSIERTFGQGMDQRLDIPTGVAGRINLVINSRGRLNGYSIGFTYPA